MFRPQVVVLSTGGTIATQHDPDTGAARIAASGDDLVAAVPELGQIADVFVRPVFEKISFRMTPADVQNLASVVRETLAQKEVAGVVVTHGTDTMEESALMLDLLVDPRDKPVVFTGVQLSGDIAGIVTTLGIEEGKTTLSNYPEALQQLTMANAIVLTKTDRVDGETLQQAKHALAHYTVGTPVFTAGGLPLDWSRLLDTLLRSEKAAPSDTLPTGRPTTEAEHPDIAPCVICVAESLDWQAFGVWLSALLAEHGEAIVRVKGVIPVRDWQGQIFHVLINGVQHVVHSPEHVSDPNRLPQSPALVFFLRGIAPERIRQSLHGFLNHFASRYRHERQS